MFDPLLSPNQRRLLVEGLVAPHFCYKPGSVDPIWNAQGVWLAAHTADYLYSEEFTPHTIQYEPGSRPFLEEVLAHYAGDASDPLEVVDRLVASVPLMAAPETNPFIDPAFRKPKPKGGSEEVLVKKGGGQCNEMARLLVTLAQMRGIPARGVGLFGRIKEDGSHSGGHMACEFFAHGRWRHRDSLANYAFKVNGEDASAWELRQHPPTPENQPPGTFAWHEANGRPEGPVKHMDIFGDPEALVCLHNYFVQDHHRYDCTPKYLDCPTSRNADFVNVTERIRRL